MQAHVAPACAVCRAERSAVLRMSRASRRSTHSDRVCFQKLRILFFTTGYHAFCAGSCAKKAALPTQGTGAKIKFCYWCNALLCEYLVVLVMLEG